MSNQFLKLRRSSVPGKVPTTSSLEFGEIALNTYDGLAFMKKSGSNGEEVLAIGSNAVSGSPYFLASFNELGYLSGSTIFQSGGFTSIRNAVAPEDPNNPDVLYVNGDGIDTYNLISAHGNQNGYVQLNIQNYSNQNLASSDVVATANNGDEINYYVNMGINGENYTNSNLIGGPNDAYLYSTGNDLLIGNASAGKRVIIFNGGFDTFNNSKVFIHEQGTVGINTSTYDINNPPSLQIKAPNSTTYNVIQAEGETDNFSQIANVNKGGGEASSADIVAYNNIDPIGQAAGFVDMGINSTNYVYNGVYPGAAGDAYVFTDSHHMILGTVSQSGDARVTLFAGGISENDNAKLILFGSNQHVMSGSLNISGSIVFTNGGRIIPDDGGQTGSVDIKAGDPSAWAELQSYDADQYIWVDNTAAYIGTNWTSGSHSWTFDRSGFLYAPGDIFIPDSSKLYGTASWALTASYAMNAGAGGIQPLIATGSVTASVDKDISAIFLIKSASNSVFSVNSTGSVSASGSLTLDTQGSFTNLVSVKNNSVEYMKINGEGVLVLNEYASPPSAVAGGLYFNTVGEFFVGT